MADDLDNVYELVARRLLSGKVVPVLGAGPNLGDRPPGVEYQRGRYLPSGRELAKTLARFADPDPVDRATWDVRGVDILHVRVENFVAAIEQRLPALVVPR